MPQAFVRLLDLFELKRPCWRTQRCHVSSRCDPPSHRAVESRETEVAAGMPKRFAATTPRSAAAPRHGPAAAAAPRAPPAPRRDARAAAGRAVPTPGARLPDVMIARGRHRLGPHEGVVLIHEPAHRGARTSALAARCDVIAMRQADALEVECVHQARLPEHAPRVRVLGPRESADLPSASAQSAAAPGARQRLHAHGRNPYGTSTLSRSPASPRASRSRSFHHPAACIPRGRARPGGELRVDLGVGLPARPRTVERAHDLGLLPALPLPPAVVRGDRPALQMRCSKALRGLWHGIAFQGLAGHPGGTCASSGSGSRNTLSARSRQSALSWSK